MASKRDSNKKHPPSRRGRRPAEINLRKVALKAGVGLGTASRALNGEFNIRAETLKKVQDAALALGYKLPNPERRPLPAGTGRIVQKVLKHGRIAFLVPDRNPAGLTTLMSRKIEEGINQYFFERKIMLIPACFAEDGSLPPCLSEKQVDGFIVRGDLDSRDINPDVRMRLAQFPHVGVMWSGSDYPMDTVMPDKEQVGRLAARMLVGRGRRRLVCICADENRADMAQSIFGFMHEAGLLGVQAIQIVRRSPGAGRMEQRIYHEMADELRSLSPRTDGVFFVSGQLLLLPLIKKYRIRPSRRMDFVSEVSSEEATGDYRGIPFLFINAHVERVGRAAAEQLLWRIQHPGAELRKVIIEPEIMGPGEGPS